MLCILCMLSSGCDAFLENQKGKTNKNENQPNSFMMGSTDGGGGYVLKRDDFSPLGKGVLPIGAWISPPRAKIYEDNPNYITKERFKDVRDAGLNFIVSLYENTDHNSQDVLDALDAAEANQLKLIVNDPGIACGQDDYELMSERVKIYSDKPSYLGSMLYDEPAIPLFDDFSLVRESFERALPDSVFYINLMPNYAKKNQCYKNKSDESGDVLTKKEYRYYLEQYAEKIKPRFISYDYYPCTGTFPNLKSGYFENMCEVREVAAQNGIPFWVFIQSCSFGPDIRVPVKGETFWQVNTALAMGCRGIQYFCYWMPLEYSGWEGGIVSKTGEKTPIYDDVREMNRHIAAIDEILMNSDSIGVITVNSSPVPIPEDICLKKYGELKSAVSPEIPAIIGCFNYEGKPAYYLVNNSIEKEGPVVMEFDRERSFNVIQKAGKRLITGDRFEILLEAGEGVMIQVTG